MTGTKQIQDYINSISPIEPTLQEEFCNNRIVKSVSKGTVVTRGGDVANKLYFLHSGVFRYYLISKDGKDITKDFAIDNQNPFCMAYSSFMTNHPSHIFIEALTDSEISVWSRAYVFPLLNSNPYWLRFSQRIAMGMYIRKEKKEISLIKDLARKRFDDFKRDFPDLLRRIPQHYVASYLNITPETLSRIKKKAP